MESYPAVDRNVVITFTDDLNRQFIGLSNRISQKLKSKIRLNATDEIPHLSLYNTVFPERNIPEVMDKLEKLAKTFSPFKLQLNVKFLNPTGTIFINAQMSDALYGLHNALVDCLNPLREGLFSADELRVPGVTPERIASLKNFGMWAAKEKFVPHVSVARVEPVKDGLPALKLLPEIIYYETSVDSISFAVSGHDGTCAKILHTFPLK